MEGWETLSPKAARLPGAIGPCLAKLPDPKAIRCSGSARWANFMPEAS